VVISRRSLLLAGAAIPTAAYGQCVTDTPAVDACLGGVRLTGPSLPPGATLDLNFMQPGTLDPRITFTRASTGTYFDSAGTMQTAAVNAPRWDYDPVTLQIRGLLLEDQRTNAAINSITFTGYTQNGVVLTRPAGTAAPDGSALTLVTENTANSNHAFYGGSYTATAAPWTVSVFIRAGTQRYISLRGGNFVDGVNLAWITFDTQTQTINANPYVTSSGFTALPGGTFRIWLTSASTAVASSVLVGGSNVATAPIGTSALGASYTGTSQTWYAWGIQAEAGGFPTSLVTTTNNATAVTRSIDSCFIPPANMGWFTSPGGSWLAEFIFLSSAPLNSRVIGRPDTPGGAGALVLAGARSTASVDGSGGSVTSANVASMNVVTKAAATWTAGQAKICLNGGAVATSAAMTTGFGIYATTGNRFMSVGPALSNDNTSGHIRHLSYAPLVWSDAQMQQVTT